jgi:flagellar protein FlaG
MSLNVHSLSVGVPPQELPQEKRPPLLGDQKFSAEQVEAAARDEKKTPDPAANLRQISTDLESIGLAFNRRLKFVIDQDSREITIKVIDNETDKVIKVLPPEELQRLHSRIRETIGFLIDRMV